MIDRLVWAHDDEVLEEETFYKRLKSDLCSGKIDMFCTVPVDDAALTANPVERKETLPYYFKVNETPPLTERPAAEES